MIKIGDKVKFNKYIPKNYLTNHYLKKALDGKRILVKSYFVVWAEDKVSYRKPLYEDIVREGIFVGKFRKKLKRDYKRTRHTDMEIAALGHDPSDIFGDRPLRRSVEVERVRELPERPRPDRYSTDPARLDNPRKLDKMAMVNYKGMLLGVPMTNLYKCTYEGCFEPIS